MAAYFDNPSGFYHGQAREFDVDACSKNNCKCSRRSCMYYNEPHYGHHDYTKVEMPLYGPKTQVHPKVLGSKAMYEAAKTPYENKINNNNAIQATESAGGVGGHENFASVEDMGDMSGSYAQGIDGISLTDRECEQCPSCKIKGKCDHCYSCLHFGFCEKTDTDLMKKGGIHTGMNDDNEKQENSGSDEVEGFNILGMNIMDKLENKHLLLIGIAAVGAYLLYRRYNGGKLLGQATAGILNNRTILILVAVVAVILAVKMFFPQILEGFNGNEVADASELEWKHKDAAESVVILTEKYGAPKILHKAEGGIAVWTADQLQHTCFVRIEVHDESVYHCKPAEHRDHTYHFVNYDVSPEKFLDVTSLSGSVNYDPLKKLLRARCGDEQANIATLALATQIGEGNVTLNFVQGNDMYKAWIMSTKKPDNVKKLYELLCYNVQNQKGNPISEGVWPLAFPEGC